MKKIEVDVILITYNHEKFIKKAIESILVQKVNFEYKIFIADDYSTDDTRKILIEYKERYNEKIELIFREKNIGIMNNICDAYSKCKSKYIALLEGDDFWINENKLQKQYDLLEKNIKYIACAHKNILVNLSGKKIGKNLESKIGNYTLDDLIQKGLLYQTATLFFRNIFLTDSYNIKMMTEISPKIGDLTIAIILLKKGNIYILEDEMSAYRVSNTEGNYSSTAKALRDPLKHLKEYFQYLLTLERVLLDGKKELIFLKARVLAAILIYNLKNIGIFSLKKTYKDLSDLDQIQISFKVKKKLVKIILFLIIKKLCIKNNKRKG